MATFLKRNTFYSCPNIHSDVVGDVTWRLVCRMCGARMVTGGRTAALCKPRDREGEKCKEEAPPGAMKVNRRA